MLTPACKKCLETSVVNIIRVPDVRMEAAGRAVVEVDPRALAHLVPENLELDRHEGRTLVSLVGFLFLDTRVLGLPLPFQQRFEEVNLRFYVRRQAAEGAARRGVLEGARAALGHRGGRAMALWRAVPDDADEAPRRPGRRPAHSRRQALLRVEGARPVEPAVGDGGRVPGGRHGRIDPGVRDRAVLGLHGAGGAEARPSIASSIPGGGCGPRKTPASSSPTLRTCTGPGSARPWPAPPCSALIADGPRSASRGKPRRLMAPQDPRFADFP